MGAAELDIVFLIGAPRSGTTWFQRMLGAHDAIATPPETAFFALYVDALEAKWREQTETQHAAGLPAAMTRTEFDEAVTAFITEVYRRVLTQKPGARIVLDKTPLHALFVDSIERYLPRARFVHIVRDGRDVVSSILEASRSWAPQWGLRTPAAAARVWDSHTRAVLALAARRPVHELRYEELTGTHGPELLQQTFEFCGVDVDLADAAEIYDAFDLNRDGRRTMKEARGLVGTWSAADLTTMDARFVGAGRPGTWTTRLSKRERASVERVAGPLLEELGYAEAGWSGSGRLYTSAVAAVDALTPKLAYRGGHLRHAVQVRGYPRLPRRRSATVSGVGGSSRA
jgi:hypothetical protein